MPWGPGRGGRIQSKKKGAVSQPSVYQALLRSRVEPVNRLVKIAETCGNVDIKIGLWKYLIEQRFAELPLLIESGLVSAASGGSVDIVKALESSPAVDVPKTPNTTPNA